MLVSDPPPPAAHAPAAPSAPAADVTPVASAAGHTRTVTLAGRRWRVSTERHEARKASAPHRKPRTWNVAVVALEGQAAPVWRGTVGAHFSAREVLRACAAVVRCGACPEDAVGKVAGGTGECSACAVARVGRGVAAERAAEVAQ